ncbi:MAG: aldolase catalytic domain-containing protein [Ruminococcus sp.]|jgi:4-hydroxy 2-oxovalerate aldolase
MSIQILDCTLRDGGYINNWKFGKKTIRSVLDKLERAGIDIIECGFLTGMVQDEDCSLFDNVTGIEKFLPSGRRNSMYVAMIAIGEKELHPVTLPRHDGRSIDGIRLTFHKAEIEQAFEWAKIIMEKGYQVFMQPVGTIFYSDLELLTLVEKINQLNPYAFYIVDTLGSMYRNDVSHRFYLIDKNMNPGIRLGFHGHNNLQLAFSNAQVLGKIQTKRPLILDSSVYGMGRGAGNLPTELITQYINKNIASRYDTAVVMDIYDDYISAIRKEYEWGYSMPYHIAASHVCHPSYAAYLMDKRTLTMKDIEEIIRSIPEEDKILYDRKKIEQLYVQFQNRKIDDEKAVNRIRELIHDRKVLLLAPGKSLSEEYDRIIEYIDMESPYVITVNFLDKAYRMDACFVSNHKRMDMIEQEIQNTENILTILTSNIPSRINGSLWVDYKRYTNSEEMISDNAGLMLLKLLKECGAGEVILAGFDGFHHRLNGNYYSRELNLKVDETETEKRQALIRKQLKNLDMNIRFLTRSVYEEGGYV